MVHGPRHQHDAFAPGFGLVLALTLVLAYCTATVAPRDQQDLCAIFAQRPDWYDEARAAESRWGTPVATLMAFAQVESGLRPHARPAREWLFGLIPAGRPSSAYGYGQIGDAAWSDYERARGSFGRSRADMADVLDFIGWYNRRSTATLGIALSDAERLYLAYHEGPAGYRGGDWRDRPALRRLARRVGQRAHAYAAQLARCGHRFRCDAWYEVRPWCDARDG